MTSPKLNCTLPVNTTNVRNKGIFVTGGSDGIGAGLVRALACAGAYVTFGDINSVNGMQLQEELNAQGLMANFVSLDVRSWRSQVDAFKSAISFPPTKTLDIVFLNAGIAAPTLLGGIASQSDPRAEPSEPALKVYDVNLLGVVRGISLALHHFSHSSANFNLPPATAAGSLLAGGKRKAIIVTGSLASYLASPTSETYGSSKFGVRGLFKGLRNSLPDRGVRINMVAPTYVRTSLMAPIATRMESIGIKLIPVQHVVNAMLRLACDESVNGRSLGVGPNGAFDFGDDFEGHDGFLSLKKFIESGALGGEKARELRAVHPYECGRSKL